MDPSQMSIQDLESGLFGGPINETAPQLAAAFLPSGVDPSSLSDSSSYGGADYSFYSNPSAYLDQRNYDQSGMLSALYAQTAPSDLSQLDPSYYDY